MDVLTPERLVIVALFLAVLLGARVLVLRNGPRIGKQIMGERRMALVESLALGGQARAHLLTADSDRVLIVNGPRGQLQVLHLGQDAVPPSEPAAEDDQ